MTGHHGGGLVAFLEDLTMLDRLALWGCFWLFALAALIDTLSQGQTVEAILGICAGLLTYAAQKKAAKG